MFKTARTQNPGGTQNFAFPIKKAFTLIELLVVIAIIGILATLAVIALQQARSKARDTKRLADVKQVSMALELFLNNEGRYPTIGEWESGVIGSGDDVFMYNIPSAPLPADGTCAEEDNSYSYEVLDDGSSYALNFCLGRDNYEIKEGVKRLEVGEIYDCKKGEELIDGVCVAVCDPDCSELGVGYTCVEGECITCGPCAVCYTCIAAQCQRIDGCCVGDTDCPENYYCPFVGSSCVESPVANCIPSCVSPEVCVDGACVIQKK